VSGGLGEGRRKVGEVVHGESKHRAADGDGGDGVWVFTENGHADGSDAGFMLLVGDGVAPPSNEAIYWMKSSRAVMVSGPVALSGSVSVRCWRTALGAKARRTGHGRVVQWTELARFSMTLTC
jgi:hypothetical protein